MTSQNKELSVLRKENRELKKFLAILKESPSWYQRNRLTTPWPVGITSPTQPVHNTMVKWSVHPPWWHLSLTGWLAIGAWDKEPETFKEAALPETHTEAPLPASTHGLSYRTSFASSGLGIFSFRPSLNSRDSDHIQVLTPTNLGQRESRSPLERFPGFQLPVLQTLPTKVGGISQGERSMGHSQTDHLQGLIYTYCWWTDSST